MSRYDSEIEFPTVRSALESKTVDDIKQLLALTNSSQSPTRKADLVTALTEQLQGASLKELWKGLDETQQLAVAEVLYSPEGEYVADQFEAKYGKRPQWNCEKKSGVYSYRETPSLLRLFIYNRGVPDDLAKRLKAFVKEPPKPSLALLEEPPATFDVSGQRWNSKLKTYEDQTEQLPVTVFEAESIAAQELLAVLRLVDAGKLSVGEKTKVPGQSSLRTVDSVLTGGDFFPMKERSTDRGKSDGEEIGPIRAFAWVMLLQSAGLAQAAGGKLTLSKAGTKALSQPPIQILKYIWDRWLKSSNFDEMTRIDVIKGQSGKGKAAFTKPERRHHDMAQALALCPEGRWLETDEFFRYIQAEGMDLEVLNGNDRAVWRLYISDAQHGSLGYSGFHSWSIINGPYARCLLFEYLATLGIVDIAFVDPTGVRDDYSDNWGTDDLDYFSRYDGLLAFRLTAFGSYCLGLSADYTPKTVRSEARLSVLANLEIAALDGALVAADKLFLDTWAAVVSEHVWRLSQEKCLGLLEAGRRMADLKEFLEQRAKGELPSPVKQFLEDLAGRESSLEVVGQAQVLACRDAALAALIANDTRTGKYCFLAKDKNIVIPSANEKAFRRGLKQLGYHFPH